MARSLWVPNIYPALKEEFVLAGVLAPTPLPSNTLDWIERARPMIGNRPQNFDTAPFWIQVYEDNHPSKVIVNGRQTYKSTYGTNKIGNRSTSKEGVEVTYCVDRQDRARAWSKQRLRRETFLTNPPLRPFLPHGHRASVDELQLTNGSVIYIRTDEGEFGRVEGLSNVLLLIDECQYCDLQFLAKATYSLSQTKGDLELLGIGGEAGSEWYRLWKKSDQKEWIYDDKLWREKLTFDGVGNITNDSDALKGILSGRWVATEPRNYEYSGYHMPQTIFPTIPLTIKDAIEKYHSRPQNSIEYQRVHFPLSVYTSHTLGGFFKAERRPVTPEMVEACYVPYLSLLTYQEVKLLKETFRNEIIIGAGVDWGSSPSASQTVVSVVILWRKSNRYQLAWIDPRPQEHGFDQARYIADLLRHYVIDYGVGDLGYGQDRVKLVQDGGRDSRDNKFAGLGNSKFIGCRSYGDETKPQMEMQQTIDEHGTELGRLQIDITTTMQNFVDLVGTYVSHPSRPTEEALKQTQFMIPYAEDFKVDFLMDDMTDITRKDLEKVPDMTKEDPRQKAKKEFNHPRDTVMSIIYAIIACNRYDPNKFKIIPLTRKR